MKISYLGGDYIPPKQGIKLVEIEGGGLISEEEAEKIRPLVKKRMIVLGDDEFDEIFRKAESLYGNRRYEEAKRIIDGFDYLSLRGTYKGDRKKIDWIVELKKNLDDLLSK